MMLLNPWQSAWITVLFHITDYMNYNCTPRKLCLQSRFIAVKWNKPLGRGATLILKMILDLHFYGVKR
jgi:hypothetical protein